MPPCHGSATISVRALPACQTLRHGSHNWHVDCIAANGRPCERWHYLGFLTFLQVRRHLSVAALFRTVLPY